MLEKLKPGLGLPCSGSCCGCEQSQPLLLVNTLAYDSLHHVFSSYPVSFIVNMSLEKGEQIFVVVHAQHRDIFWWGSLLWNLWRSQVCSFLSSSCAYWLERRVWIRLITFGCWALLPFSTVHKLKKIFLSTHTHTHTHLSSNPILASLIYFPLLSLTYLSST